MAGDSSLYPRQVLEIWLTVTGRGLTVRAQRAFVRHSEVPQLVTYLRRHGRTWLEGVARRRVRGRGPKADLRLADWIMAARDYSERPRKDEAPARHAMRKRVRGLPPPQLYSDDT